MVPFPISAHRMILATVVFLSGAAVLTLAAEVEYLTLALQDHLNHKWSDELVHYRAEFPERSCKLKGIRVAEAGSDEQARYQISAVEYWPGVRKFVKGCTVSIRTHLGPLERKEFLVHYGAGSRDGKRSRDRGTEAISEEEDGHTVVVSNSVFSVRLFRGERKLSAGEQSAEVLPPILSVKRGDGPWLGRGTLRTNSRIVRAKGERIETGPLFNDYRFEYSFADGGSYVMELRFLAGQDYLLVEEHAADGTEGAFVYSFADNTWRRVGQTFGSEAVRRQRKDLLERMGRLSGLLDEAWLLRRQPDPAKEAALVKKLPPIVAALDSRGRYAKGMSSDTW